MDLSLTEPVVRTQRLSITLIVPALAVMYDLTTAVFRAQVVRGLGSSEVLYEWKTGGSSISPNSVVSFEPSSKTVTLIAPSSDLLAAFPDSVMKASTTIFKWEAGFYLPVDPDDFRGIGLGDFPVQKGAFVP